MGAGAEEDALSKKKTRLLLLWPGNIASKNLISQINEREARDANNVGGNVKPKMHATG